MNFLQYSSIKERERDEVLQETNKDKEFQSLKHYISTGWPVKRSQIPVFLHPYWNFRDELMIESGILMKNSRNTEAEISEADTPGTSRNRSMQIQRICIPGKHQ